MVDSVLGGLEHGGPCSGVMVISAGGTDPLFPVCLKENARFCSETKGGSRHLCF